MAVLTSGVERPSPPSTATDLDTPLDPQFLHVAVGQARTAGISRTPPQSPQAANGSRRRRMRRQRDGTTGTTRHRLILATSHRPPQQTRAGWDGSDVRPRVDGRSTSECAGCLSASPQLGGLSLRSGLTRGGEASRRSRLPSRRTGRGRDRASCCRRPRTLYSPPRAAALAGWRQGGGTRGCRRGTGCGHSSLAWAPRACPGPRLSANTPAGGLETVDTSFGDHSP
jgi:hypothetical protein